MSYNFIILTIVLMIILALCIICNVFYIHYLKKIRLKDMGIHCDENKLTRGNKVLKFVKADVSQSDFHSECPAELPNTDDDVADVIKYINPTNYAGELLENLYEQTRI